MLLYKESQWINTEAKLTLVIATWLCRCFCCWLLMLQWWTCGDRRWWMHSTEVLGCTSGLTQCWWSSGVITPHWLQLIVIFRNHFRSDFTRNWCCLHGCIRCCLNVTCVGTRPDGQNTQMKLKCTDLEKFSSCPTVISGNWQTAYPGFSLVAITSVKISKSGRIALAHC